MTVENITLRSFIFQFQCLCHEYLIDPGVALENEQVQKSFNDRDIQALEIALKEEF